MKYKNNDLVPQIFIAVVGVILVGIIIYYVMNSVQSTTKLADAIILDTEKTTSEYCEYDIAKYDGEDIRGSEVTNFIKKHIGNYDNSETAPIYVEVITMVSGSINTNTYNNKEYIESIRSFSDVQHYVKPTAIFKGEVIRTVNKVIIGVRFSQKWFFGGFILRNAVTSVMEFLLGAILLCLGLLYLETQYKDLSILTSAIAGERIKDSKVLQQYNHVNINQVLDEELYAIIMGYRQYPIMIDEYIVPFNGYDYELYFTYIRDGYYIKEYQYESDRSAVIIRYIYMGM